MAAGLAEQLKRTALFSGLSDRQVEAVLAIASRRRFGAGEEILRRGQEGGVGFYLILQGRTEVRADGTLLAELGPGDYFGEVALLIEGSPRTADVVAVEETDCLVITQWAFRSLLAAHPDMSMAVMAELARRLRATTHSLAE